MKNKKKQEVIKPGDACLDAGCHGKFVVCLVCSDDNCGNEIHPADKEFKIVIPGMLNQIQNDLLSSFLVGHWKEITESGHGAAFEDILGTLNPSALEVVKKLAGARA